MKHIVDLVFQIVGLRLTGAALQTIKLPDKEYAVDGGNIQITCQGLTTPVNIYKTDTTDVSSGTNVLSTCLNDTCLPPNDGMRYTYVSVSNTVSVIIYNLTRQIDQKYWTCLSTNGDRAQLKLVVYTIPTRLEFYELPVTLDLSISEVILHCETDCAYPRPDITWFYTMGGEVQHWMYRGIETDISGSCTDGGRIYRSALSFPKYTTWSTNTEVIVQFECGIVNVPGLNTSLFPTTTVPVQFAVKNGAEQQLPVTAIEGVVGGAFLIIIIVGIVTFTWRGISYNKESGVPEGTCKESDENCTWDYVDLQNLPEYGNVVQEYGDLNVYRDDADEIRNANLYLILGRSEEHAYDGMQGNCSNQTDESTVSINPQI